MMNNNNLNNLKFIDYDTNEFVIPPIADATSAAQLEETLNKLEIFDKVVHLSKDAHVQGSSAFRILSSHLRNNLPAPLSLSITNDSMNNLFVYIGRRGDMVRKAMARTSEDSGLDKTIDTGLLIAYEDIHLEYSVLYKAMNDLAVDDPQRPTLAKECRYLRREMLAFKELVAPAVQKMDIDSKVNHVDNTNQALLSAVDLVKKLGS